MIGAGQATVPRSRTANPAAKNPDAQHADAMHGDGSRQRQVPCGLGRRRHPAVAARATAVLAFTRSRSRTRSVRQPAEFLLRRASVRRRARTAC